VVVTKSNGKMNSLSPDLAVMNLDKLLEQNTALGLPIVVCDKMRKEWGIIWSFLLNGSDMYAGLKGKTDSFKNKSIYRIIPFEIFADMIKNNFITLSSPLN